MKTNMIVFITLLAACAPAGKQTKPAQPPEETPPAEATPLVEAKAAPEAGGETGEAKEAAAQPEATPPGPQEGAKPAPKAAEEPLPSSGVLVSTPLELIKAIEPGKVIRLAPGTFDLSLIDVKQFGAEVPIKGTSESAITVSKYVLWETVFDGWQLVIRDVDNLTIEGSGTKESTIAVQPRYANVLTFRNAKNVTITNLVAGHMPEPGGCVGGVLSFEKSKNIAIDGVDLFGSGMEGLTLSKVVSLACSGCIIRDCTYGIMTLSYSKNISFTDCKFSGNKEYDMIQIASCSNVMFEKCEITGNRSLTDEISDYALFKVSSSKDVLLSNSKVTGNTAPYFASSKKAVTVKDSVIENNTFTKDAAEP